MSLDPTLHKEITAEAQRLTRAEELVGHVFQNRGLLLQALTHRSFLNEHKSALGHNEVLELLGDAVLSLVVVERLLGDTPAAQEGELSDRRAAHVSEKNLAKAAATTGLAELMRTGNGLRPKGKLTESVAADGVEAVLGAVFREGGLEAARKTMLALLGPPPQVVVARTNNPRRALGERFERLFGKSPEYVVTRGDGPNHDPSYRAVVAYAGHPLGEGSGKSMQQASEEAAAAAVASLSALDDPALRERLSK
ncbi:MAG: ribonuclease III domain-containing protein [Deltaproteobacteria bacterium]|nr:ribonuclease III domain-containing protein [Deltaproteobacteria bacterium]